MNIFDAARTEALLNYPDLIDALEQAFSENPYVPERHHITIPDNGQENPTLLLMPA